MQAKNTSANSSVKPTGKGPTLLSQALKLNDRLFDIEEQIKAYKGRRLFDPAQKQALADLSMAKFNGGQEIRHIMPKLTEDESRQVQEAWHKRHAALHKGV